MPRPTTVLSQREIPAQVLGEAVDALVAELELVTEFPEPVQADAQSSATSPQTQGHADWTQTPFVTIDPPGATDLDQAMHLERRGSGYRVHYAIADVPAFVRPGSPVDEEARRRGQTLYAPDRRIPLHPPVLSEDAASLLPDQDRPAFVWTIDLDEAGATTGVELVRAIVRSRAQLTYEQVQADIDAGKDSPVALLSVIGPLLQDQERARGGSALAIPDQEVVANEDGGYELRFRPARDVDDWNAQISLLTGMSAAKIMLDAKVGVLRTLPAPDQQTLDQFRRRAAALGTPWPAGMTYGEFLRTLDPNQPRQLALLHVSARLFRGAGYTVFDGEVPADPVQAAVGGPYAHVTAPLRRLVDRFGLVTCEHALRGEEVPGWVREALPGLPEAMQASDRRAGALERAAVDLAEALLMTGREGEVFDAVVISEPQGRDQGSRGVGVQLLEPAVEAQAQTNGSRARAGDGVKVRLVSTDVAARRVTFELAR